VASLQDRQLALIERMAALDPAPCLMGGWAEDALLAGEATRPHVDIDWLLPRSELPLRQRQAAEVGFASFETWGESAPGITIRITSPLALDQLRAGIASVGSFGQLNERQQQAMQRLRERFFPERAPAELVPPLEPLPA
jgi:hypothetical protein